MNYEWDPKKNRRNLVWTLTRTGGDSSVRELKTDWERLRSLRDAEIRTGIEKDPDSKATDQSFGLQWLRLQKGYQPRINAVLRTYMDAQKS